MVLEDDWSRNLEDLVVDPEADVDLSQYWSKNLHLSGGIAIEIWIHPLPFLCFSFAI